MGDQQRTDLDLSGLRTGSYDGVSSPGRPGTDLRLSFDLPEPGKYSAPADPFIPDNRSYHSFKSNRNRP